MHVIFSRLLMAFHRKTLSIALTDNWHRTDENFLSSFLVYLDGTKSHEELLSCVYSDVIQELKNLMEGSKYYYWKWNLLIPFLFNKKIILLYENIARIIYLCVYLLMIYSP